jgi:hypothetical protein
MSYGSYPAEVPPTIPAKRPAEIPAEQRSPVPKFVKPPSLTASPALAAAKKPVPQSSPLVPPAPVLAPPPHSLSSPALKSSPPKPLSRDPPDSGVIDLTQATPELAPAAVQNRTQPSKLNPQQQAPPAPPNPAPQPPPQPAQPPTQSQPSTTSQPQLQPSMQPQPQPSSQPPSLPVNLRQFANADTADMQGKLNQVEIRMRDMNRMRAEAAQAGRTEDASRFSTMLSQQMVAYRRGREFVAKVMEAKRLVAAAQAQGSPQSQESAPNPGTNQHPTPTVSVTPQATPPTNPHSTPRLATPRQPAMSVNQSPMSAMTSSPQNVNPNSGANVGVGSTANANAALLQAFNPAATQIPQQVSLGGAPGSDAHVLGSTPQHGHSHNNSLGQQLPHMSPAAAAHMKIAEQRGLAQGNQGPIASGSGAGTNAGPVPITTGGLGERTDHQWSGTLMWQGTDTTRNEKKEVRAQVTATASIGNPCAPFSLELPSIGD